MCRGDIKIQYDVGAVVSVLIFGWGLFEATLFLRVIICNIRKELVGFCVRLMCTFNTVIRNIIYIIIVFRIVSFWNVHKGWKSLIRHQRIAKALIKAHWAMCCACVCVCRCHSTASFIHVFVLNLFSCVRYFAQKNRKEQKQCKQSWGEWKKRKSVWVTHDRRHNLVSHFCMFLMWCCTSIKI